MHYRNIMSLMAHTISQMSSRFLKTITTGYLFFADIHYFYIMKWRHAHQFFQFSCFYLSICLAPIIQIIIDIFSCFLWLFCITIWQCRYIKVFVKRWRHSVVFAVWNSRTYYMNTRGRSIYSHLDSLVHCM